MGKPNTRQRLLATLVVVLGGAAIVVLVLDGLFGSQSILLGIIPLVLMLTMFALYFTIREKGKKFGFSDALTIATTIIVLVLAVMDILGRE